MTGLQIVSHFTVRYSSTMFSVNLKYTVASDSFHSYLLIFINGFLFVKAVHKYTPFLYGGSTID